MNRLEKAAYFGQMMGKVAAEQGVGAGRRTLTPVQRQDADEIINGFNDLKKPVDPKALMAERAVHRYEPTFQANRPAKPQISDKDISGMQGAFGGQQPQTSRDGGIGGDVYPPWRSPNASERQAMRPPPRSLSDMLSNPTFRERTQSANQLRPNLGPNNGGWSNAQKAMIDPAGQHPFNFSHNMPTAHPGPDTVQNMQLARPGE